MMNKDKIKIEISLKSFKKVNVIQTSISLNDELISLGYHDYEAFIYNDKDNRSWFYKEKNIDESMDDKLWSEFYPFSCSCGVAGCNGIWEGIKSKHRKKSVEWRVPVKLGYEGKLKSFYSFDKNLYENEIKNIFKQLKSFDQSATILDFSNDEILLKNLIKELEKDYYG